MPRNITANRAAAILAAHQPAGPVEQAWHDLADEHLADLRRIDTKLTEAHKKITPAVRASGTTLTEVFGVDPVIVFVPLAPNAADNGRKARPIRAPGATDQPRSHHPDDASGRGV